MQNNQRITPAIDWTSPGVVPPISYPPDRLSPILFGPFGTCRFGADGLSIGHWELENLLLVGSLQHEAHSLKGSAGYLGRANLRRRASSGLVWCGSSEIGPRSATLVPYRSWEQTPHRNAGVASSWSVRELPSRQLSTERFV